MTVTTINQPGSMAAVLAMYVGKVSNWLYFWPSYAQAQAAYEALPPDLQVRIASRASQHGMEAWQLMQKVPQTLWDNPSSLDQWLNLVDVSHIQASSVAPELQSEPSNWTWELRSPNRARQANEMTGEEFYTANDQSSETAYEFTGDSHWWDLNDLFHGFLQCAQTLGYSAAWLPKNVWLTMMNGVKRLFSDMRTATTFAEKVKVAHAFVKKIVHWLMDNNHVMAAAFTLGVLTLLWAPAKFFVGVWAGAGLLSLALHVLRTIITKTAYKVRPLRGLLRAFNKPLKLIENACQQVRDLLDQIKNGIFTVTATAYDLLFKHTKVWTGVITKAAKAVVKQAKNALFAFIGWVSSQFTKPVVATA